MDLLESGLHWSRRLAPAMQAISVSSADPKLREKNHNHGP
jgi:hypothetical protein